MGARGMNMQSLSARGVQVGWAAQLGRIADALEELVTRRRGAPAADPVAPQSNAETAEDEATETAFLGRQIRGIGGALALIAARRDAERGDA